MNVMILFVLLCVNVFGVSLSKSYETFVNPLIEMVEEKKKWENYVFSPASVQEVAGFVYPALTSKKKEEFAAKFGANKTSFEARDLISIFDQLVKNNKIQTVETDCVKYRRHRNKTIEYKTFTKKELHGLISTNKLWVAGKMNMTEEYEDFVNTFGMRDGQSMVEKVSKEMQKIMINDWIKNQTQGKIQDIYQDGSDFVLCNAMYLHYVWQFSMDRLRSEDFNGRDQHGHESTEKVSYFGTRGKTGEYVGHCVSDKYQAIRLPLSTRRDGPPRLQFVVVLPNENEHIIPPFLYFKQTWKTRYVSFKIPEFKIRQQVHNFNDFYELTASQLPGLGLEGNDPISLMQAATITVNHYGVSAAAATIYCTAGINRNEPIKFHVTRPFSFLIVDDVTEAVLFQGKVFLPVE